MYSRQLRSAIWFVFAVVSLAVARPRHQVAAGPHLRRTMLSRSQDNDWEPSVAVGPNAAVYVTAIRSDTARARAVIWSSHDGGRSFGSATMTDSTGGQGDVRVKTDDNGTIYVSSIGRGLDLATSRDGGKTFATRTIETQELRDKPELAVSLSGRDLYIAFDGRHGPTVMVSHDGAAHWQRIVAFRTDTMHHWPSAISAADDHRVYFTASTFTLARLADSVTENTMRIFASADDGHAWASQVLARGPRVRQGCVHNSSPTSSCLVKVPTSSIAVDAKGRVYAAYTTGQVRQAYRMYFVRSADGGRTWSDPTELGSATRALSGDRADIDFPMVAAAGDGLVYLVWADDRDGPVSVWATRSSDGGRSWSADVRLSRDDQPMNTEFYGDYGGVAIDARGALHAAWGEGVGSIGRGQGHTWYAQWDGTLP